MQYRISTTTDNGKLDNKIRMYNAISANSLTDAKNKIDDYNKKHPNWDMRLEQSSGYSDDVLMPIEYR